MQEADAKAVSCGTWFSGRGVVYCDSLRLSSMWALERFEAAQRMEGQQRQMKELITQWTGKVLIPFSEEALDALRSEYKVNQLVTCRTTKLSKDLEPSLEQQGTLYACFKLVSENSDLPQHRTPKLTKLACKVGIDFRDSSVVFVRPDGGVQLEYRSFNFRDLRGKEREVVMDKAFNWLAEQMGVTVEVMVAEAKSRMQRRG